jgi:hypothetical protein
MLMYIKVSAGTCCKQIAAIPCLGKRDLLKAPLKHRELRQQGKILIAIVAPGYLLCHRLGLKVVVGRHLFTGMDKRIDPGVHYIYRSLQHSHA